MPKKQPLRMCVSCRGRKPKKELIRVVISPDMLPELDQSGKKPGRGAYVCRARECLRDAIKGRKIDKGLKAKIGDEVIDELLRQLEEINEKDDKTRTG